MRCQLFAQTEPRSPTFGLFGLLNGSFVQRRFSTNAVDVPYVPTPKAVKILLLLKAILYREQKADHNSLYMERTGRNVRSDTNNVDQTTYREHC